MQIIPKDKISITPGKVIVDKDSIRDAVERYASQFKLVVSEDDVKLAKKAMAELNKTRDAFKKFVKAMVEEYEKPIKDLKSFAKEIDSKLEEVRNGIKIQVSSYEEERKEEVRKIIMDYLESLSGTYGDIVYTVDIDRFVKLSSVTKSGNVTKQTAELLEAEIVRLQLERQKIIEEELRRQAEVKIINRRAIEEYKAKRESMNEEEPKLHSKEGAEKVTKIAVIRVSVTTSKSDDEVRSAISKKLAECGISVDKSMIEIETIETRRK